VTIASTQGPGLKLELSDLTAAQQQPQN